MWIYTVFSVCNSVFTTEQTENTEERNRLFNHESHEKHENRQNGVGVFRIVRGFLGKKPPLWIEI